MVPKRQPYSPWCGSPTICCPQNVVFGELMAENLVPAGSGSKSVAWSEDEGPLFVSVVVKLTCAFGPGVATCDSARSVDAKIVDVTLALSLALFVSLSAVGTVAGLVIRSVGVTP